MPLKIIAAFRSESSGGTGLSKEPVPPVHTDESMSDYKAENRTFVRHSAVTVWLVQARNRNVLSGRIDHVGGVIAKHDREISVGIKSKKEAIDVTYYVLYQLGNGRRITWLSGGDSQDIPPHIIGLDAVSKAVKRGSRTDDERGDQP